MPKVFSDTDSFETVKRNETGIDAEQNTRIKGAR